MRCIDLAASAGLSSAESNCGWPESCSPFRLRMVATWGRAMQIALFAFFLLAGPAIFGQAGPVAVSPAVRSQRLLTQTQPFVFSAPCQPTSFTFQPAQTLLAQNQPLSFATIARSARSGTTEPIPTQWPHARFEPIPTQWSHLKMLPVGGPAAQTGHAAGSAAPLLQSVPK